MKNALQVWNAYGRKLGVAETGGLAPPFLSWQFFLKGGVRILPFSNSLVGEGRFERAETASQAGRGGQKAKRASVSADFCPFFAQSFRESLDDQLV